jgi:hypothetical protein
MRQVVRSRLFNPSPVCWGTAALAFSAAACVAQPPPEAAESPAGEQQLAQLSLAVPPPIASARPAPAGQDIGLQWRQPIGTDHAIDVTAWRRIAPQPDAASLIQQREPMYGARVEMRIAPASKTLSMDLKAIGLQLDNGAKIMLRRKNGNPTLYYRQQF